MHTKVSHQDESSQQHPRQATDDGASRHLTCANTEGEEKTLVIHQVPIFSWDVRLPYLTPPAAANNDFSTAHVKYIWPCTLVNAAGGLPVEHVSAGPAVPQ